MRLSAKQVRCLKNCVARHFGADTCFDADTVTQMTSQQNALPGREYEPEMGAGIIH